MTERIVFLDRETLRVKLRAPEFQHDIVEYERTGADQVVERLHRASICITNKVPLHESALARLSGLRLIAVAATGTDIVELAAARARGIVVCNIRGYAETTVPEHVLALLFALRRNLLPYAQDVRQGAWQTSAQFCAHLHPIGDLAGSTLGIVGYGVLGQAVARLAGSLGMRVLACDVRRADGLVDFATVLRESDAITLHVPLTPETRGMIGAGELSRMRRHALLINTARGGLVDEAALAAALRAGTIAGAGVDVLSAEPPGDKHPLLASNIPNLIVTPHVAWASVQAQAALAEQLVGNLEAFHRGAPRNVVN